MSASGIISPRARVRRAFTLVELLVVIGIIALLIGILLPALNRAREKGRQVACLSNMRQLSMAMVMFANEHKGYMPASGGTAPYSIDPFTGSIDKSANIAAKYGLPFNDDSDAIKMGRADWICWSRHKDPYTGITNTSPNENITYSALRPYLGAKLRATPVGDYDASNNANATLDAVFRCPSDYVDQRPSHDDASHGYYRYSYAMNTLYASGTFVTKAYADQSGKGPWGVGQRCDGHFTGKISSIRNAAQKILLICEDEKTVDDGEFSPNPYNFNTTGSDTAIAELVAARHDRHNARASSKNSSGGNNAEGNEDAKGNVGFCDGHADFMGRKDALRQKYTGNPNPDPPGF